MRGKIIICLDCPTPCGNFHGKIEEVRSSHEDLQRLIFERNVICLVTEELGGSTTIVEFLKKAVGGSLGRLRSQPRFFNWEHIIEDGLADGDLFLAIRGADKKVAEVKLFRVDKSDKGSESE